MVFFCVLKNLTDLLISLTTLPHKAVSQCNLTGFNKLTVSGKCSARSARERRKENRNHGSETMPPPPWQRGKQEENKVLMRLWYNTTFPCLSELNKTLIHSNLTSLNKTTKIAINCNIILCFNNFLSMIVFKRKNSKLHVVKQQLAMFFNRVWHASGRYVSNLFRHIHIVCCYNDCR